MSDYHCAHCSRNRHESYYDCSSEDDVRSRDSIRNTHQRSANILQNLGDLREFYKQLQNFADITHEIFKNSSDTKHRISSSSVSMHRRKSNTSFCCNYNCQYRQKYSTDQRQSSQIYNDSEKNHISGSHQDLSSKRHNTYCRSAAGWIPNRTKFPKFSKKYSLYMELENTNTKCQSVTGKLSQNTEHQGTHGTCSCRREHHDKHLKQGECLSQGNIKHNNSKRHDTPNHKSNNYGVSNKNPISTGIDFGDKCERHNYLNRKCDGMCSRAVFPTNHQTNSGCSTAYKNTRTLIRDANVSTEHNRMVNKEVQTHIQDTNYLNKENNDMINKEVQTEFFKKSNTHINKNANTFHSAPNLRDSRISSVVQNSKPNVLCTEKLNNKKLELIYFSQISEKCIRPSLQQDNSILNITTISKLDQKKEIDHKAEIETEKKIEQAILLGGGIRKESSNIEHYQPTNKGNTHYKNENNCSSSYKSKQYESDRKTASASLFEREYTKQSRDSNQYHVQSQDIPNPVGTFVDESKSKLLSQKSTVKSSEDQNSHIKYNKSIDRKLKPTCNSKEITKPVENKNEISEANSIGDKSTKDCNQLKTKEESYHTTESRVANDTKNPMIAVTGSRKKCVDMKQNHIRNQESTEYDSKYICRIGEKSKPKLLDRRSAEENTEPEYNSNMNKKSTFYKLDNECIDVEQNHIRSQESTEYDSEYICKIGEKSKPKSLDWRSAEENSETENNSNLNKKYTTYKLENTSYSMDTIYPIETEKKMQARPRGGKNIKEFSSIEHNQLRNKDESHLKTKNIRSYVQNSQQYKFAKNAIRPVPFKSESKKEKRKFLRSAEEYSGAENNPNIYKKSTNQRSKNAPYSMETIYSIETEKITQAKPLGGRRIKEFSNINCNHLGNKEKLQHSTKNIRSSIQNSQQYSFAKDNKRSLPFRSASGRECIDIENHIKSEESTEYVSKCTHRFKEKTRPKPLVRRCTGESLKVEDNPFINKTTHQKLKTSHYTIESGNPIETENEIIQAKLLCVESVKELYNVNSNQHMFKKKSHYRTKNISSCVDKSKHFAIVKDTTKTIPFEREIKKQLRDIEQSHVKSQEVPGCLLKYLHSPEEESLSRPLDLSQRSTINRSEIENVINNTSRDQQRDHTCHSIETNQPNVTEKKIMQAKPLCGRSSQVYSNIERTQLRNKKESHHKAEYILSFIQKSQQFKFAEDATRTLSSVSGSKKECIDIEQNDIRNQESTEYVSNHTSRIKERVKPDSLVRNSAKEYFEAENNPNIYKKSTNQKLKNSPYFIRRVNPIETEENIQKKKLEGNRTKGFSNIDCNQLRNKNESSQKIENILSYIQNSRHKFPKDTTRPISSVIGNMKKCIDFEQNPNGNQELPAFVSKYTSRIKENVKPKSLDRKAEEFFEVENNQIINKEWAHQGLKKNHYTIESGKPIEAEIKAIKAKPFCVKNANELDIVENNQLTLTKKSDYNTNNIDSSLDKGKQLEIVKDTLKTIPFERKTTKQETPDYVSKYTCKFVGENIPKPLDLSQRSTVKSSKVDNKHIVNNKTNDQKLENTRYFIERSTQVEPKKGTILAKSLDERYLKESNIERVPKSQRGKSTEKYSKINNNNFRNQKSTNEKLENNNYPVEKGKLIKPENRIIQKEQIYKKGAKNFSSIERNQLRNKEQPIPETENIRNSKQNYQYSKFVKDTTSPVSSVIESKKKSIDINKNYKRSQEFLGYVSKHTRRFEEKNRPRAFILRGTHRANESVEVKKNHNIYQESTDQRLKNKSNSLDRDKVIETGKVTPAEVIDGRSVKEFSSIERNQLKHKGEPLFKTENIRNSIQNSQQYKVAKDATSSVPYVSESKKKLFDAEQNQNLIKSPKLPGDLLKYTCRFEEESKLTPLIRRRVEQSSEVKNIPIISNKLTHQRLENNYCIIGAGQPIETDVKVIQPIQAKEFLRDESYQLRKREESLYRTENVHSSKQNSHQHKYANDIKKPAPSMIETKNEWFYIKENHDESQELLRYVPKTNTEFVVKSKPVPLVRRCAEESSESKNSPIINQELSQRRLQNSRYTIESVQPNKADMKDIQTIPPKVRTTQEFSKNDSYELRYKTEANNSTENIRSGFDKNKQYEIVTDITETTPFEKEDMRQLLDTEQYHIRNQEAPGYVLNYCRNCVETSKPESIVNTGAEESTKVENNKNIYHESTNEKHGSNYYSVKTDQPIETERRTIQSKPLAGGPSDESFNVERIQVENREKSHHETKNILSSIAKGTQHKIAKDTATLIASDRKCAEELFESAQMHIEKKQS